MTLFQQQRFLFNRNEILPNRCKQFNYRDKNGTTIEAFIVHSGGKLLAYKNACPHWEVELNWKADDFLNFESDHIICAVHGALFKIEDGLCIHGPCLGQKLEALPIQLYQEKIFLGPD